MLATVLTGRERGLIVPNKIPATVSTGPQQTGRCKILGLTSEPYQVSFVRLSWLLDLWVWV